MDRILKDFISLFFPRTCVNCKKTLMANEEFLCLHCKLDMPITNSHLSDHNPLMKHLISIENLKQTFTYLKYNKGGIAQKLLHKLKYEGIEEIGYKMGLWMGYEIVEFVQDVDLIVPVPLHDNRLEKRGYNQSDSICRGLSESLEIDWNSDVVKRSKDNQTQTQKNKLSRWLNTDELFQINNSDLLEGKNIMIVDDVITTGATIESVARVVNEAGAKGISVACLASGQ